MSQMACSFFNQKYLNYIGFEKYFCKYVFSPQGRDDVPKKWIYSFVILAILEKGIWMLFSATRENNLKFSFLYAN